tara:strand:- start:7514 stop:8872 length:1359 start_codon:yes stop_codon:yes gene_type:complete
MFSTNILLDIVTIVVIIIIIIIIFFNCIYIDNTKYVETYSNFDNNDSNIQYNTEKPFDEFTKEDILKKCPRGCGHHKSVPDCSDCNKDRKNYENSTPKEKFWLDKYHIIGDQMKVYAENKILEWEKIHENIKFRYTFLKNNKLHTFNIHPDYFNVLYNIYNPEKNSSNDKDVAEWMKKLELNTQNYNNLTKIDYSNDWKYIELKPKEWMLDCINDYVMTNNLFSKNFQEYLSKDDKIKYNITDSTIKITEYLSNIGKPLDKSHDMAQIRWKMFKNSTNELVNKELYALKIIENISNGNGLHIDDIILLFSINKDYALEYINLLIQKLEIAQENKNDFIKTYKTENSCLNECFVFNLKTDCPYNDDKTLFTALNIPVKTKNNLNISMYNFWPIFKNNTYTINEKILLDNNETNYCSKETLCYSSNSSSKENCLFLNPSSISEPLINNVITKIQ